MKETLELDDIDRDLIANIMPQIEAMKVGDTIDAQGLFDEEVWAAFSPDERRHFLGRRIARLVRLEYLPLESVGLDSARHNLYRKIAVPGNGGDQLRAMLG